MNAKSSQTNTQPSNTTVRPKRTRRQAPKAEAAQPSAQPSAQDRRAEKRKDEIIALMSMFVPMWAETVAPAIKSLVERQQAMLELQIRREEESFARERRRDKFAKAALKAVLKARR